MCKTHSIRYTCTHIYDFRLSVCNGHFTTCPASAFTSREPSVLCSSAPVLRVASKSDCGSCLRAKIEGPLHEKIDELRLEASAEAEAEAAETSFGLDGQFNEHVDCARAELSRVVEDLSRLQHQTGKQYPSSQQFKHFRIPVATSRSTECIRSRLTREINLDELPAAAEAEQCDATGKDSGWAAWYEDWNGGWNESICPWPAANSTGADHDSIGAAPLSCQVLREGLGARAATVSLAHEGVSHTELLDSRPSLRRASGFLEEEQQQRVDLDLFGDGLTFRHLQCGQRWITA